MSIFITPGQGGSRYSPCRSPSIRSSRPPTVQVDCAYPGASAQVGRRDGGRRRSSSRSTAWRICCTCRRSARTTGAYSLTVTFKQGIDLNVAQVLVQNRVSLALPLLPGRDQADRRDHPQEGSRHLDVACPQNRPGGRYDQLYLSNYATLRIKDELARLPGGQRTWACWASGITACGSGSIPRSSPARSMTAGGRGPGHPRTEPPGRLRPDRPSPPRPRARSSRLP